MTLKMLILEPAKVCDENQKKQRKIKTMGASFKHRYYTYLW